MARSPDDDALFADLQNRWNYMQKTADSSTEDAAIGTVPGPSPLVNGNSNRFTSSQPYAHSIFSNLYKSAPQTPEMTSQESATMFSNQNSNIPKYGIVRLGNGQIVKVLYDNNNQPQLMIPITNQYELFSDKLDMPTQAVGQPNFNVHQPFGFNHNSQEDSNNFPQKNINPIPPNSTSSSFLKDVVGNWVPNVTGTYSPFGENCPLTHPESLSTEYINTSSSQNEEGKLYTGHALPKPSPKRFDSPLSDNTKKRIVAEVKPMRPSYSDVLAKNTKNLPQVENNLKNKPQSADSKTAKTSNAKPERPTSGIIKQHPEESKRKSEKNKINLNSHNSSSSESGDVNNEKYQKASKKGRNKKSNLSRRWSSLDDMNNEEDSMYNNDKHSQFLFIQKSQNPTKKASKHSKSHNAYQATNKILETEQNEMSELAADSAIESNKSKKKSRENRYSTTAKSIGKQNSEKKKQQPKRKGKSCGYQGVVQQFVERWTNVFWKALMWFWYLLLDVVHMSAHLSLDLCTSVVTQTVMSSQAVWRSTKRWVKKITENKFLVYVDKKLGHTWFGFWRKIKWFNKNKVCEADTQDSSKANTNIPLPSTGEEAMKRLLACKGKDAYSILGVRAQCSDEDIRRYYRRQAFLVHPDKNAQPGAEEAFKILQHAFDLIGEPERREAYDQRALECRNVEAAWTELSELLAQLHDKMESAANTIRCTNCGRRHKRVLVDRPCYAARYCAQCKIRHSAKEGDIWAESSMFGVVVMYYACMDGAVYLITQWANCQKKNLAQLKPDSHVVQYRIVLGSRAQYAAPPHAPHAPHASPPPPPPRPPTMPDANLEEFISTLYGKTAAPSPPRAPPDPAAAHSKLRKRNKKNKI